MDILCLQETKLQEIHVDEMESEILCKLNFRKAFWNCSRGRKGYSGTAIFVLNDSIEVSQATYRIGDELGDIEGRTITLESPWFTLINTYTPNSGAELKKLDYRTQIWDRAMGTHVKNLRESRPGIPIVLIGDLNVAHKDIDYYNPHNRRMRKQPGTTPEEQKSFEDHILSIHGLKDTYRSKFPTKQEFSYFSAIKGEAGRARREGLRIDYVVSGHLF